jgi:hypothetical protein
MRHVAVIVSLAVSISLAHSGARAIAAEKSPAFEVVATLKLPEEAHFAIPVGQNTTFDFSLLFRHNQPFRAAVLRFPWIYVLSRSSPLTGRTKLSIFRLPAALSGGKLSKPHRASNEEHASVVNEDAIPKGKVIRVANDAADGQERIKVDFSVSIELPDGSKLDLNLPDTPNAPGDASVFLSFIDDVGDGQNLMRWDDFLVCTRWGGLEVYSLENPKEPKRVGLCKPGSKKRYLTNTIVRDGNQAFVIGDHILLSYDLSVPSKPKYLGEKAIRYDGSVGCMAAGHLYLGGSKEGDSASSWGIAVFDVANPADVKELYFLPVAKPIYHLFPLPGNRLLASLDVDSSFRIFRSSSRSVRSFTIRGNSVLIDLAQPTHPVLSRELKDLGGRAATVLSTKQGDYYVCSGAIFSLNGRQERQVYSFFPPGTTCDGFSYHGDSDGTYAVLPLDDAAVVLRIKK